MTDPSFNKLECTFKLKNVVDSIFLTLLKNVLDTYIGLKTMHTYS